MAKTDLRYDDNKPQKRYNFGKWIFIIVVILLLGLISMIIAGVMGIMFGLSSYGEFDTEGSNVALIRINGVILTEAGSEFGGSSDTSSRVVLEQLEMLENDNNIKAVIFEINSPGGSGVAADEIAMAIKNFNKTTVAFIREMGASAAYWIASATDQVYANRMSAVGSIGVIGSFVEFSGFMDDYNVTYQRFIAGEYKDFGTPFRKPTLTETEMYQQILDDLHVVFINEVADNRNMTVEEVEKVAHGFIFTGMKAKDLRLIDDIGGKKEAIAYIEKVENITVEIVEIEGKLSFLDLLGFKVGESMYNIGQGIGDAMFKEKEGPLFMFK